MNMGKRIKLRLEELHWQQRHLLEKVPGLETGTLSALIARDSKRSEWSEPIAAALGVTHGWLTRGDAPKLVPTPTSAGTSLHPESNALWETRRPVPRHLVPVVGKAKLGDEGYFVELEYPVGHGDGYIDIPTNDPNAYALHCVGSSMLPRIKPGEYVVMEPNTEVRPGDEVLVRSADGRVMIKEWLYTRDDHVHLGSVNNNQPKIAIPVHEIDRMHYVAAIVKRARWTPDYEPERRREDVTPNPQRRIGEENWAFPGDPGAVAGSDVPNR
jgi:phage repressor protein C with HTH and peptisase S24 domain